jgi:23S rRNA pseudouridine1911/1915/1917 synthase
LPAIPSVVPSFSTVCAFPRAVPTSDFTPDDIDGADEFAVGDESPGDESLARGPRLHTVEDRAHGWRVDYYLSRLYPNYSRSLFQRALAEGTVLVNGLPAKAARRLRVNDRLQVALPALPDQTLQPEDIPLKVLYEDDALIVINKQADLVTHPGKSNFTGTLAAGLQFHFDQLSDAAGSLRPGIVHRLDRDTTGVIVVAKNNVIHHRLSGQFERREVTKEYRAIVRGAVANDGDIIRTFLKPHPKNRQKMIVCGEEENAREAVTTYEVLERFAGFSYVRLLPKTGRTHQLRVHMRHIGHPIVADALYAGHDRLTWGEATGQFDEPIATEVLIDRQALHAFRLELTHPGSERRMLFEAPLPDDMQRLLETLRARKTR